MLNNKTLQAKLSFDEYLRSTNILWLSVHDHLLLKNHGFDVLVLKWPAVKTEALEDTGQVTRIYEKETSQPKLSTSGLLNFKINHELKIKIAETLSCLTCVKINHTGHYRRSELKLLLIQKITEYLAFYHCLQINY